MKTKYKVTEVKLHISDKNSKMGKIANFSTLPGNSEHMLYVKGELLTDVPGTCTGNCEGCFNNCYAVKSCKLHHNKCIEAWGENTLLLRSGGLEEAVDAYIKSINENPRRKAKIEYFRINCSGEVESAADLEVWNNIAQKNPSVKFGIYTKNYEALTEFMDKYGDSAKNFVINISQWHHLADNIIEKYKGKLNVFEYDDSQLKNNELSEEDKARLEKTVHCPAVTKKGKHAKNSKGEDITCISCTRCYQKRGRTTAVYAH